MGKMVKLRGLMVIAIGFAFATQAANADIVTDVTSGGASEVTVAPGGSFSVDVVVSSLGEADRFDSFIVDLTHAGLTFNGYTLGAPFVTGSPDDFSIPSIGSYSAFTPANDPFFLQGTLITLDLTVPAGASPTDTFVVSAEHVAAGGFVNAGDFLVASEGGALTVRVPEPATLAMLAFGGFFAARRRRRTA